MRVLLSTYRPRGDAEPMVGLVARLRALGAEARACAPPDFAEPPARVGAVAEGGDAPAAGGVMPAGVWR